MAFMPIEENQFSAVLLTSNDDLNNIKDYGMYSWSVTSVPTNAPSYATTSYPSCTMICSRIAAGSVTQLAYDGNHIFIRAYFISEGTWNSWKILSQPAFKTVTYENTTAITIVSNSSQSIPLSLKSGDSITGYVFVGLSSYNLDSGVAAIGLACKAISTGNIVIENLGSSSITIAKGAVVVTARYMSVY